MWQVNVKVSDQATGSLLSATTQVVAVTDKAVIATYDDRALHLTVALDPATGKILWDRKNYVAAVQAGDVVAGTEFGVPEGSSKTQITALDVATGQQKWVAGKLSATLDFTSVDPGVVVVVRSDYDSGDRSLLFLDPATGAEKTKVDLAHESGTNSGDACQYDQQSTLTCRMGETLTGYDAKTGQQQWSLPDKAANRVAPASVLVTWHGALYGTTKGGQPIVLDAKTGKDLSTDVGAAPTWVSEYAGVSAKDETHLVAYPVEK
ncbi:hypothetical protein GCM10029964_059800 [Kibdelosporangium lantanae]